MRFKSPRIGLLLVFLAVLLIAGAAPGAAALPTVPNVVGMKLDAASSALKKEGFGVNAVAKESWFPGEHLKVYRQTPRPGPLNRANKTVTIWYFWDRTQDPKAAAKKPDRPAPLRPPEVKAEPPLQKEPARPAGHAKQAAPAKDAPGEKPAPGADVITPAVLGMDRQIAEGILARSGLKLKVVSQMSTGNRFLADTIASQEPKAGFTTEQGSTVMVTVYDYLPNTVKGVGN